MGDRRWKMYRLTTQLLARLFMTGERHYRVVEGLPEDARVVWATFDPMLLPNMDLLDVMIESETFDPVPDGEQPPETVFRFEEIPA